MRVLIFLSIFLLPISGPYIVHHIEAPASSLEASEVYKDLVGYRKHISSLRDLYFDNKLSYKHFRTHDELKSYMSILYRDCRPIVEWLETANVMIRALSWKSDLHNDYIYDVFIPNLEVLTESCY